jgi:hypothetical protein
MTLLRQHAISPGKHAEIIVAACQQRAVIPTKLIGGTDERNNKRSSRVNIAASFRINPSGSVQRGQTLLGIFAARSSAQILDRNIVPGAGKAPE